MFCGRLSSTWMSLLCRSSLRAVGEHVQGENSCFRRWRVPRLVAYSDPFREGDGVALTKRAPARPMRDVSSRRKHTHDTTLPIYWALVCAMVGTTMRGPLHRSNGVA